MAKDLYTARIRLFERLVTVMRDQLNTDIGTLETADSGLLLPDVEEYYLVDDEARTRDELANVQVAAFIWTLGETELSEFATEFPSNGFMGLAETRVAIAIRANPAPQADHTELGATLTAHGLEKWRAERYLGALTQCIYQHACVLDDIERTTLRRSTGFVADGWTFAQTEWVFEQDVIIPTPDFATV